MISEFEFKKKEKKSLLHGSIHNPWYNQERVFISILRRDIVITDQSSVGFLSRSALWSKGSNTDQRRWHPPSPLLCSQPRTPNRTQVVPRELSQCCTLRPLGEVRGLFGLSLASAGSKTSRLGHVLGCQPLPHGLFFPSVQRWRMRTLLLSRHGFVWVLQAGKYTSISAASVP